MTLSPQARFAAGTAETLEIEGHALTAPGPIRALAYYDRGRVLAGGDFAGIYLLDISHGPQKVATADPGTTLLASSGSSLAFGNSHLLALASDRLLRNRVYKGVSKPPTWVLLSLLGLFTPVAIYFLWGSFGYLLKKALGLQPSEKHEPKPEEEEPIPSALVEACQNGDCVLWAGSGLARKPGCRPGQLFCASCWNGRRKESWRRQPSQRRRWTN